jgi:hypothetical protein
VVCALKRGEVTQLPKCCLYDNTHPAKNPTPRIESAISGNQGQVTMMLAELTQAGFEGFGGSGVDGMSYPEEQNVICEWSCGSDRSASKSRKCRLHFP